MDGVFPLPDLSSPSRVLHRRVQIATRRVDFWGLALTLRSRDTYYLLRTFVLALQENKWQLRVKGCHVLVDSEPTSLTSLVILLVFFLTLCKPRE